MADIKFNKSFTDNFEINPNKIPYPGTWYIQKLGNVDFTTLSPEEAQKMLDKGGEGFDYFKAKKATSADKSGK